VHAAGIEQLIRSTNVGLKRRNRGLRGHTDERLRTQVNHHVHFRSAHGTLDCCSVVERAVDLPDLVDVAAAYQLALRIDVRAERHDRRPAFEQGFHHPRADNARRAGDQDAPSSPREAVAHAVRLRYACGQ
jgi:hypothetical protein